MKIVYQSYEGRYSDSPRAMYEAWAQRRPGDTHTWIADAAHADSFPADTATVPPRGDECVAALESADLLIANTHTNNRWAKPPGAVYLQTWHGTPLKRIHSDVLWAPPGLLDQLDEDIARWDLLISPNSASTARLRGAFKFDGAVAETGLPRNDALSASDRDVVRRRVRDAFGIDGTTTVVLYTPTWRDDVFYGGDDFYGGDVEGGDVEAGDVAGGPEPAVGRRLDVGRLAARLGPGYCVLVRRHYFLTDAPAIGVEPGVLDVSYHPNISDLYLAADVMVTDYSSTMFDFAVTGKPLLFYTYDLAHYRDEVRGLYFDLEPVAPGPMIHRQDDLTDALLHLDDVHRRYRDRYERFQQDFCERDDGGATDRVLDLVCPAPGPAAAPAVCLSAYPAFEGSAQRPMPVPRDLHTVDYVSSTDVATGETHDRGREPQ